ncbi:MAG: energy transducer TonB [Magnetococcales bacterium]|nr:energy transducer TonB [Magnetococcales bacterium]
MAEAMENGSTIRILAFVLAMVLHGAAVWGMVRHPPDRPPKLVPTGLFEMVVLPEPKEPVVGPHPEAAKPLPPPDEKEEISPVSAPDRDPVPTEAPVLQRSVSPPPKPSPKVSSSPHKKKSKVLAKPAPVLIPPDDGEEEEVPVSHRDDGVWNRPTVAATTADAVFSPPYVGGAVQNNPKPVYPSLARRRGWEGLVLLHVEVDEMGHPQRVEIKQSSGFPILDRAAVDAVNRWQFVPARRGGVAVGGWVDVPVQFRLT